jgi:hypothetical protein
MVLLHYHDWRILRFIGSGLLVPSAYRTDFEHMNQANKGCGEGSEKEIAEQGPKGSVFCFDGMYFHCGMMKHARII